jgi:hypothetical protein
LEKCQLTLKEYVSRNDLKAFITRKEVVLQIFEGFAWLHSQNIGENLSLKFALFKNI